MNEQTEAVVPSARCAQEFERAVRGAVSHCKRSLLDCIDLVLGPPGNRKPIESERAAEVLELLAKRVHNDVSLVGDQVMSVFTIYKSGGIIQPFGRGERNGHGG